MALGILGPFNKIINETTKAIIDSNIVLDIPDVLNTLIRSSFESVEEVLKKIQDITKEESSGS